MIEFRGPFFSRRTALQLLGTGVWVGLTGCTSRKASPKPPEEVNGCRLDPRRLLPLLDCMESCGPEHPRDEWDHSCVHPETVAYSCGRLYRHGQPNVHDHDPEELERCRKLAEEAAKVIEGVEINLSESSSELDPFFITANRGDKVPEGMTREFVIEMFNGAIYPVAHITISPLEEGNSGWESFAVSNEDFSSWPPAERERLKETIAETLRDNERRADRWRELIRWFKSQDELFAASFVEVGNGDPLSEVNFGCVFPRLVGAITKAGSLVGVMGHAVHT